VRTRMDCRPIKLPAPDFPLCARPNESIRGALSPAVLTSPGLLHDVFPPFISWPTGGTRVCSAPEETE
jgi:hypothetical protein